MARGPEDYSYSRNLADRVRARRGVNELPGRTDARRRPARLSMRPNLGPPAGPADLGHRAAGRAALRRRDIFATPSLTAFIDVTPRTLAAASAQLSNALQRRSLPRTSPPTGTSRSSAPPVPRAYRRHSSIAHRMPLARNEHTDTPPHDASLQGGDFSFQAGGGSDVTCGGADQAAASV